MAIQTKTQLTTTANADLPDNSTAQISPADVRGMVIDIIDSMSALYKAVESNVFADSPVTVTNADYHFVGDCTSGSIEYNLPAVSGLTGLVLVFTKSSIDPNNLNINADGSELINGNSTITLTQQYSSVTIQCDGTGWVIIGVA